MHLPGARQKYQCMRKKKRLNGYDDFNTYVVVRSLRDTIDVEHSDVQRHLMTSEVSRVVRGIYCYNKNTTVLSTLFVPYLNELYIQLLSRIKKFSK